MDLSIYREVKNWKKPIHASKTAAAKTYIKLLPNVEVIGIAGSVGKTLTQNAIYSVLSQKYKTVTGPENLDPTYRIPQTILKAKPWDKYLILEYGVEHQNDMDHYLGLVTPKYVVMTILSPEHTKYLKDMEGVLDEESKILKGLPASAYALLNADDKNIQKIAASTKATIVWYGHKARPLAKNISNFVSPSKRSVKISHFVQNLHGAKFRIHYGGNVASVHWKIIGKHQLSAAYAAATMGILAGLTIKQIAKGLAQTKAPEHRLNLKVTEHVNILDDTYNSSPQAAKESIATLVDLGKNKTKVAVLGEMRDLGALSEAAHFQLGEYIAKTRINYLVTVGKVAADISKAAKKAGFNGKITNVKNTKEAVVNIKDLISTKTLFLVKGSRHEHLERIVLALLHKSTTIECYHCGKLK